jgi:biotin transport system permease protein/energy-coupling factor transport system permease protein
MHVDTAGLLVVTGLALIISGLGRIPLKTLLGSLRPVLSLFFFLFLMYAFFTPGKPLLAIGVVQISHQGLQLGLLQIWRFVLLIIIAAILTMTTLPSEITIGLERLLRPIRIFRISSHDIAMMVSLALRFIPTLLEEVESIREAQLARGVNFKLRTITGKMRTIVYLIESLSISIFRRCDELVDAMEARGYQQGHRTYLRELSLSRTDFCTLGGIITVAIAIIILFG